MTRGNGSSIEDYADRSDAEAAVVEEHEGLAWLAQRLRNIRIAILRLLTTSNQLSSELELELKTLEQEFERLTEGADGIEN